MAQLTTFRVGHCTHPACMALKGAGLGSRCFPSRAYLITTTTQGLFLWDTGYTDRFKQATSTGIFKLYPWVTPVYFDPKEALVDQLRAMGVSPRDVHTLILSHFHADHIAGLRDFPQARLMCSQAAWLANKHLKGLAAVRKGFVPALLPDDIESRLTFVEATPASALPGALAPFEVGRDVSGSGEILIVDLPGHAVGHLGAFIRTDGGWVLLATDAAWAPESYQAMTGPSEWSFVFQHDRSLYYQTLRRLHALHLAGQARIHLTHELISASPGEAQP